MTISPNTAAVLNITPNHLDRHGSMQAYSAAKQRILDFQSESDTAILGRDDAGAWKLHDRIHGNLLTFGTSPLPKSQDGTYLTDDLLHMRQRGVDIPLLGRDRLQLRGNHNLLNALAAFAIGLAITLPLDAMLAAAEKFRGVPHRLELVRELNGVKWYNGSIATAPERTMADIRSFTEPIVLLLGGRDKDLPWNDLAELIHKRVDHVILFGEAKGKIAAALNETKAGKLPETIEVSNHLEEAVQAAAKTARSGDVVLLSPGGTSFDEFQDFEERGEAFKKWVSELS
jgi:UDP-N-acetylmuramoylalanine--D-glutamate ligase